VALNEFADRGAHLPDILAKKFALPNELSDLGAQTLQLALRGRPAASPPLPV
jgi:hypothetical protein